MGRFSLNGKALILNKKFVEYNNGVLSFQVSGTHFPYSNYEPPNANASAFSSTEFLFESIGDNKATINYGDGSIITYNFKKSVVNYNLSFKPSLPMGDTSRQEIHSYTDGNSAVRIVKISFTKPENIVRFYSKYLNIYGSFPNEISSFSSLSSIEISQSLLTSFPVSISTLSNLKTLSIINIGTAISSRFPDEFLPLNLSIIELSKSIDFSDVYSSNLVALLNSNNANSLLRLIIESCNMNVIPDDISNLSSLEALVVGGSNNFVTMPSQINSLASLTSLNIGSVSGINTALTYWSSFSNLVNLNNLVARAALKLTTNLPNDLDKCLSLKTIMFQGTYHTQLRIDTFITNYYNFITSAASKIGSSSLPFRGVVLDVGNNSAISYPTPSPTGTYKRPIEFVLGSYNGNPSSPKEMIWVLVNQYAHTITYTA